MAIDRGALRGITRDNVVLRKDFAGILGSGFLTVIQWLSLNDG